MNHGYFEIALAVLVGIFGSGRIVRLFVGDDFPPTEWIKLKWMVLVGPKWGKVLTCPWCLAPYVVAANMAFAILSNLHWTWWVFNGWLAAAYVTSWIVFHDED